jgi:hypothetical protein
MPRKSASKKQRGGSLASNRVMGNLDTAAVTHDYVVSPRIRTKSKFGNTNTYQLTGGACGACEGAHQHKENFGSCGGSTTPTQSGGGEHLKENFGSCNTDTTTPVQSGGDCGACEGNHKDKFGDHTSCASVRQSGGYFPMNSKRSVNKRSNKRSNKVSGRRVNKKSNKRSNKVSGRRVNKRSNKRSNKVSGRRVNKKSNKRNNKVSGRRVNKKSNKRSNKVSGRRKQRGGGSAWMASQYSQSLAPASHARSSQFSQSAPASRHTLMNPPNMGLAGSELGGTYDRYAPAN